MAETGNPDITEVIIEQDEDETALDIPPDRRRVKTEKSDLPVDTIFGWVSRGKINPQPDFQRYYVWNEVKASRLIESLLLDIPIPVIYVAEEANKSLSVVDGQQRITSISSYVGGKFPDGKDFALSGLQVLTSTTDKPDRIQFRAEAWRHRLQDLVSDKEPRNFSLGLKQQFYGDDCYCWDNCWINYHWALTH